MAADDFPADGGCACGALRYRMQRAPMFVHCCHCTWCQRETGSAFAVNALIEGAEVVVLKGRPDYVAAPSNSGAGQEFARCADCRVAVWSHYSARGRDVCFIRAGTLDAPDRIRPDIHIFTSTKQPWVALPGDAPAIPEYYRRSDHWPAEAIARYRAAAPGDHGGAT